MKKHVVIFCILFLTLPSQALGVVVVDQVNPYSNQTSFEGSVDEVKQQEVTVGIEGYLVGIDLHWHINPRGVNNDMLVFLLNVGPPWQSDANDFESVITFTVQNGWNYIDVSSSGLYFLPGDKFVIGVQNAFDNTSIGGSYYDQYPAGNLFLEGQNYSNGLWDLAFRTHVELPSNNAPEADAGDDQTVNAGPTCNPLVTLDGSSSTDPDSTPGTNDDIVSFQWYEGSTHLGSEETLSYPFSFGLHIVTLIVTDTAGETNSDDVVISVVDTTPPELSVSVSPDTL